MSKTLSYEDNITDNSNTLYTDVIMKVYPQDEWDTMLTNTKFLRIHILAMIKNFIDSEKTICIKEFSDKPAMIYDDPTKFNFGVHEISTDQIIIKDAFSLSKVNTQNSLINPKYSLVLEALNSYNVTTKNWDNYLDDIFLYYVADNLYNSRVQKIMIEDTIDILKRWEDISDLKTKDMIRAYNASHNISKYDHTTFWQEPLDLISKKYWEKFSFVLTINDYDIYNEENSKYLDIIAEKYFNKGYFDEIVIKMNYFYWHDDFKKIIDWTSKNLKSALVSYRFNTIFSNNEKNRYFDDNEAGLYGDIQRKNNVIEELEMFESRLPIFLNQILTNPQTYGFELEGGYFGQEGDISDISLDSIEFEKYKEIFCKISSLSPFAQTNDSFVKIFRDPLKKIFVCMKRD